AQMNACTSWRRSPNCLAVPAAGFVFVAAAMASCTERSLLGRLDSSSEEVRCAAAEALAKEGSTARAALPTLEALLMNLNTACPRFSQDRLPEYIYAIGGLDPFLDLIRTKNGVASQRAARWVARRYPQHRQDFVETFILGLHDDSPLVREAAANGLGALGVTSSR